MTSTAKRPKKPEVKKKRPGFRGEPSETGRKILAALVRKGWTGADLADRAGVSAVTVSRWIAGENDLSYLVRESLRKLLGEGVC